MKKALLIVGALLVVVSGVAMVSAYEAHLINVTAHVENAMSVNKDHIHFGTVFPEEWMLNDFSVGVSNSFCKPYQTRVTRIDYSIWVEWKPDGDGGYYPWLGDALYLGIDVTDKWPEAAGGELVAVGPTLPPGPPGAMKVMESSLALNKEMGSSLNLNDRVTLGLDVPVFEGYYNVLTDPTPKPSGLYAPTVVILKSDTDRYFPKDGVTLGVDLKIQVENIYKP